MRTGFSAVALTPSTRPATFRSSSQLTALATFETTTASAERPLTEDEITAMVGDGVREFPYGYQALA